MNIFFVHTSSFKDCGGIGRVTEINALSFKKYGYNIHFFILKEGETDNCHGFTQFYLKNDDLTSSINKNYFREKLIEFEVDIIINQSGINVNSLGFIVNSKTKNLKIITCYHGAIKSIYDNYGRVLRGNMTNRFLKGLVDVEFVKNIFRLNYKRKMKRDLKFSIDNSHRFIFLSEGYVLELELYNLSYLKSKVDYVHNQIKYDGFVKTGAIKKDNLLYVGRINFSEKQCDLLPLIWDRISRKYPNLSLKIIGDGDRLLELKNIFKTNDAIGVEYLGYTNPFPHYEEASILLLTSAIEGFGLVLTEALNYGVVPIAFNVSSGVREALMQGKSGVLVNPFDLDEYVTKLEELILDKNVRMEFLRNHNESNPSEKNKLILEKWSHIFSQIKKS
jgi:glycosyltransferase involved in cell wall biosynthesis